LSPLLLSIEVALAGTLISLPFAVLAAWVIERSRLPGRGVLQAIVLLPLLLPPVVTGYLLLALFTPRGALGRALQAAGAPVAFHFLGAVVAAAVVGFPLLVLTIGQAIQAVDPRLETIARTLGLAPLAAFRRVTLPLAWPGILAGALLAFARGLGEFGATIVLAGSIAGETETVSLTIYGLLERPGGEARIVPLVIESVAICVAAVAVARVLQRRHRRRLELER
jgi:molybdate transport system permease protein